MTKLNHTPSKKAGQLSRHSCNQIPRGRYQQTKFRAGPGHQTRQPAGEGKAKRTEKGAKNKRGQTTTGPVGPTHAQRGAQQSQEDQETHKQEPNTKRSHEPRRATNPGNHKTTKETEGSTDQSCAERSALIRSEGAMQIETVNKEEGRAHNKKEQSQRSELKKYECTCHVYGQTHKYRENLAQPPYTWANGAPVHQSRPWTDTPVEIQNPSGQNR